MSFHQSVKRRSRISVNLDVFGFDVDGDKLLGVLLNVDLGTDKTVEDFISSLHKFGFFFGHGTGTGVW